MSKKDSFLKALSGRRQGEEKARYKADVDYLGKLGIKPQQEMQPDLSMRTQWKPMNLLDLAASGNWQQLGRIGSRVAENVAMMPQRMFQGDPETTERLHQLYGTPPAQFQELNPIEESQADVAQALYDIAEPGPGGEATKGARVFFGDRAMRQRALYFLDWARKNLRGDARRGLLKSLQEGWMLSPDPQGGLGQFHLARGQGAVLPPAALQEMPTLNQAALVEGPEKVKAFVKERKRFYKWMQRKKKGITKEYEELAKVAPDVPTAPRDTPASPVSIIAVDPEGHHPLSTMFHEGIHATDFGMNAGDFKRAREVIKETPWEDMMQLWYTHQYSEDATEQLATFMQRLGSGEMRIPFARGMDPSLAQRAGQGWDISGVAGAFPFAEGGSRQEQRAMQPVLDRWSRWREGTSGFEGDPAFIKQLEGEQQTLAQKMRKR